MESAQAEARASVTPFQWTGHELRVLDQRLLPAEEQWNGCNDARSVYEAIRSMQVRGAPAIGIAAAYGVVLAAHRARGEENWRDCIARALDELAGARPTAVNLFWALRRMRACLEHQDNATDAASALEAEALAIHDEDRQANVRMGELAREIMCEGQSQPMEVLTHCNTGALATGGYGTALGAIRSLWYAGALAHVHVDETRPWLQGSRLTAWELGREGIPYSLNADSAAAMILSRGDVKWIVVGADRIAANGDVANKVGTLNLAVLARHYGARMMVVAPSSTVDEGTPNGEAIAIEEREANEVRTVRGQSMAPMDAPVFNPVFDVTPASLIDVIVTEAGVVHQPNAERMASALFV